jgi:hypothetical protein
MNPTDEASPSSKFPLSASVADDRTRSDSVLTVGNKITIPKATNVEAALEQNKEIHRQIKVYFHS